MFGPEFEEHFIRVAFGDEGGTLYRHHWEVDNSNFLAKRVGTILNEGGCWRSSGCMSVAHFLSVSTRP